LTDGRKYLSSKGGRRKLTPLETRFYYDAVRSIEKKVRQAGVIPQTEMRVTSKPTNERHVKRFRRRKKTKEHLGT